MCGVASQDALIHRGHAVRSTLFAKLFIGPSIAVALGTIAFAKAIHMNFQTVADIRPLLASVALMAIGAGALCWTWRRLWERSHKRHDDETS